MQSSQLVRRVIALTAVLIIIAPISAIAAKWQWNRHIERDTRNELISHNAVQKVVSWDSLQISHVTPQLEWRRVALTGKFDESRQKLWRKQPFNGEPGFIAVTPFRSVSGEEFLVERGWVAADGKLPVAKTDLSIDSAEQKIFVRMRLMPEGATQDPNDLPAGQTNSPATMKTAQTVSGLFELIDAQSPQVLTAIPLPELDAGPHVGYVGQWIIIGISAIVVYITVLRRLRIEYQASETKSA
jgi:cytochrome oxidase assembly protein ShyY1